MSEDIISHYSPIEWVKDYNAMEYGCYSLEYETGSYEENTRYSTAEFERIYFRKIALPRGRGNIIHLLSDSLENTLRLLTSKTFMIPPGYRRFYYPWILYDSFMKRRFRMNITKLRSERNPIIKQQTKLVPYLTRQLSKNSENIFFSTSDVYEHIKPILEKIPIKRAYTEFFPEFDRLISSLTPPPASDKDDKEWNNRILIIDAEAFKFKNGAGLKDNKCNPLFLLYLAYLRTRDLSKFKVDRDMLITSKNMFIKFNPSRLDSKLWPKFRLALFRIMNANLDNYVDQLEEEDQEEITQTAEEHLTHNIVDNAIKPYTKNVSPSTKGVLGDAVDRVVKQEVLKKKLIAQTVQQDQAAIQREINVKANPLKQLVEPEKRSPLHTNPYSPLSQKKQRLFDAMLGDYKPLVEPVDEDDEEEEDEQPIHDPDIIEEFEDEIKDDVNEIMNNDEVVKEEVIDEIQDRIVPLNNIQTSPVNSKRDQKLREAQKKILVREATIEEILERDTTNIPIQSENKSHVLKTTNTNMHNITFANFDKTYIDNLYTKDLVGCFDMLKDKDTPFYITGIDIKDTSDVKNYQETWSVHLKDINGTRSTIKVNIPKFYDNRFMRLGGNKYIIYKQNFLNPIIKDSPDTVIITTNYQKVTVERVATKSMDDVEKIFKLIKKVDDKKVFTEGDSTNGNKFFISTLEYDELARRLFQFTSKGCEIFFSRNYIMENKHELIPSNIKGNEFFIGMEKDKPILINEDSGFDRDGRTIMEIMLANMPPDYKMIFNTLKSPKQPMYVQARLAGQWVPLATIMVVWVGISKMLDYMGIKWEFRPDLKRVPKTDTREFNYIKFQDGVLEYESQIFSELIMNGINKMKPEKFTFQDFNSEEGFLDYLRSIFGTNNGVNELRNFQEFLVDPITKEVCHDLMLPDTAEGLFIHAVKLLADNKFLSKASDQLYRVRSIEAVSGILYYCIAEQYKKHVKSGRRLPMTLKENAVIDQLIKLSTVEAYSTLNPAVEMGKAHTVSSKGFRGTNVDWSYDQEKRSYDDTSIGKIAITTSVDSNVGLIKYLTIEPTISSARGYRAQVDDVETLRDVNLFSPVEMLTPGTIRTDDTTRSSMSMKQSGHVVPVKNASPALVSNGFDEAIQFHLSNDFVINAEEDGKVVEINEELGFIVVQYKSGKNFAINTHPDIVKNSGSAFFLSNTLTPTVTEVGQKFKKDEVLAYHDRYFKYSKFNGLRYALGPLAKVAFISTYNTYEDAGICTAELAEKMKTKIVYEEDGCFMKNSNILNIVKIGEKVAIGDSLIKFSQTEIDDPVVLKYLSKLSEESKEHTREELRNDITAKHAGTVIDIKVYTLRDPEDLSPSLGKIVKQYFKKGVDRKKFLEKYDNSSGILKAGHLLTDSTEPLVTRYNTIMGYKNIDVLIRIYIEYTYPMGVGDKHALFSAQKQIVSEIIPKGYEPYSEFRPDEHIDVFNSSGSLSKRMTPSTLAISAATKIMIELKRKIKDQIKYTRLLK